ALARLIISAMDATRPRLQEVDGSLMTLAPVARLNACLIVAQPATEAFQLADTLQEQFIHARAMQQGELQRAIHQIREKASEQVQRQTTRHQRSLERTLRQAEWQTLSDSKRLLEVQSHASRASLTRLLNAHLGASQQQLQEQLTSLSHLSDMSEQFKGFAESLQRQITDQILNTLLIVLFGALLLSMLGSIYLYRMLNPPLKALMEATRTIAQGDLSHRVQLPSRGAPELEQLADSFNHMADALAKAEAQLIQTSKLASLGTLASGVAHELNQPLAIIRGVAQQTIQMLANSEDEGANSEGSLLAIRQSLLEDMRLIERQTQRMSQIIMHLRTFARKPREGKEPVNLNEVAQNALILLREQLHQRGIELVEEYDPNLPAVLGEANSLEQVVINLLTNARDALDAQEHGQVIIRTRRVASASPLNAGGRGSTEPTSEWVELSVQDNGPGVPAELRSQIFDPFFTTKEPGKGTGLGLAISLEIAQKHGGALLLSDPPEGRGACFTLRLPAAAQQQKAA
ncbi:MAG: ATP-binding protein, partial [Fimbriimonadales bacterium]|nr:ATP-binding protein [Fimbriimonadales bacterium]